MATVATQVDNVRTRFKKDPNAETVSDTTVLAFLNEAQDIIESHVILPASQTYKSVNLVGGTQEYSLESNCQRVVLVRYQANDWVLKEINFNEAQKRYTSSTGTPQEYYVWGGSIGLYPIPASNESNGLKYWYIKSLGTLVESGDSTGEVTTSEIPAQYHWVLERGAEMLMAQMTGDIERAALAERKFMEGIQLMKERYMMTSFDIDSEIYPDSSLGNKSVWHFNPYQ